MGQAIAIVGMSCRFAGAPTLQDYWRMCLEGRDAFGPIPADRWDAAFFTAENARDADRSYAPAGAFIEDVRSFPAVTMQIPPRRVEVMDPQQRMAIEVGLEAIQDSGRTPDQMPERTAVFVGVTAVEYRTLMLSRTVAMLMASGQLGSNEDPEAILAAVENVVPARPFSAPGVLANMVACSVAQELKLKGAAYSVDAACSSAIVALHDAVAHLRAGNIDAALAGGVYLSLTPEHHIAFSRIGAMSKQGRCLPFDARADGFVQGDGCGLVVLKRLDDAIRDGDRIYATIEGMAANNDGGAAGPMAPVTESQTEVIRAAWENAGTDPALLGYLEAHGTGTLAGDKAEFEGALAAIGHKVKRAALGSSKANIGHTMSAAGIAGVIRAAMTLYEGEIPPLAGFESPKDDLHIDQTGFHIPLVAEAWDAPTRVAAVSSFGFGGTNTHVVMASEAVTDTPVVQPELVLISSYDEASLRMLCGRTAKALERDRRATVAGVARAWALRRKQAWRAAIVASSIDELAAALAQIADGKTPNNATVQQAMDAPAVAFLYPGQGAQRLHMLAGIRDRFPVANAALRQAEAAVGAKTALPLCSYLYPDERPTPVDDAQAVEELTATENCQPALFAAAIALTRVLQQAGITPVVTAGHSVGEFAAAVASGILSADDGARFVADRGRAMADMTGDRGAMLAIRGNEETAAPLLVPGAIVANINHPQQVVISGRTDAIDEVQRRAEAAGVTPVRLGVSHAFHSEVFDGLDMGPAVRAVRFEQGTIPVASCIIDGTYSDPETAARVFDIHATSPVHFTRALERCASEGATIFVQVGAGGPISTFAKRTLTKHRNHVINLASNDDNDGGASLLLGLGELWVRGVDIDASAFTASASLASVPPSLLPRETYWGVKTSAQSRAKVDASLLERAPVAALTVEDAPASAATATVQGDPIEHAVLMAVAKASAYPVDSLQRSMRLMEDLGFDSMMTTDLVEELIRTVPGLTGIPREIFVASPTIEVLIDYARAPQSAAVDASEDDKPLLAYQPIWRPSALVLERTFAKRLDVLVTGDNHDLMNALGRKFQGQRHDVTVASIEDARAVDHPSVIVYCASDADFPAPESVTSSDDAALNLAEPLLSLLATWAPHEQKPDVFVVIRDDNPWHEALAGATRALAHEWADQRVRVIRFDADSTPVFAGQRVVREVLASDRAVEARWVDDTRFVRGFEVLEAATPWTPTGHERVLITGGTRGIGLRLAQRLAPHVTQVILVGRSAPDAALRAILDASNGRIVAKQADVSRADQLQAALADVGPIHVLIHSAGVLADGALEAIDPAVGRTARAIKAGGWLAALQACGPSLERAVAIGSWAGRFGNRHQTHYASANALLAALVERAPEGVTAAVSEFGPWISSDMAATIPEAVRNAMRNEGVDFVGDAVGETAILEDLQRGGGVRLRGRRIAGTLAANTIASTYAVDTHPFLADHAIDGTPIFPLASAADLIAFASTEPLPLEVRNLELFAGVLVKSPVDLHARASKGMVDLRSGANGKTLHYRAEVAPAGAFDAPAPLTGGEPSPVALDTFYRDITFHGPLLAGIVSIDGVGEDFVRGTVRVGTPQEWSPSSPRASWVASPLAFDSAMQMAALVAWHRYKRAGTPMSVERLIVLAQPSSDTVLADVRFGDASGDRFVADVVLRDLDGTTLVIAEGVAAELRATETAETEATATDVGTDGDDAATFELKAEWTDPSQWDGYKDIALRMQMIEMMGMKNPYFDLHEGTARNTSMVDGREVINFSSYNYLGYSGDPRVIADVERGIELYGTSVSASRVASGERPFHRDLEAELAAANDCEDALVFSGGHATNVNTIGHLFGPKDLILHDELIHDSCLQGIKLSGAARRAFRHDDVEHLEAQLKQLRGHYEKVLILIEGVYSMDGDIANVPAYVALRKRYGCLLMIDEAHSFGTIGSHGRGVREHFGLKGSDADIWMGTMSKSLASMGGWISGSKELIMYMRYTAPGFIFAAGIPPALGVAALSSLRLMIQEPERVAKLQNNAKTFYNALRARGLDTGPSLGESPVIPVVTGDSMQALQLSQALLDDGINAKPIIYPAVAEDAARLRFFLSSTHTEEQLLHTAERIAVLLQGIRNP